MVEKPKNKSREMKTKKRTEIKIIAGSQRLRNRTLLHCRHKFEVATIGRHTNTNTNAAVKQNSTPHFDETSLNGCRFNGALHNEIMV